MKKKNTIFLAVISSLILIVIFLFEFIDFKNNYDLLQEKISTEKKECLNVDDADAEYLKYCNLILNEKEYKLDFFTVFGNVFFFSLRNVSYFLFLFVSIPSLFYISFYFKNKIIFLELTRISYKKIKKKLFINAYISTLILTIFTIFGIIVCFLYTKTFDPSFAIYNSTSLWTINSMNNPILFIILYVLNIFIHSILYVNICLAVVRKQHNYFISLGLSYIAFIAIESILEILFYGIIFTSLLKTDFGYIFNIMNLFRLNDYHNMIFPIIIPFILMIISCFIVNFMYNDKEKLIYDIERNE